MKKAILLIFAILLLAVPTFAQEDYDSVTAEDLDGVTVDFWHQHTRFRATQLEAMIAVFNNPDVTLDEFLGSIDVEVTDEGELATLGGILDGLRDIAREYNPYGIVVNGSNQGGYGDIFDKMNLGIAGGGADLPQIVVAYQNQSAMYQLDDALVDINDLIDSESWGLSEEDQADFFAGFYNADVFSTYGGARLGFPPNRSMEMMYYNMDWLAELYEAGAISFEGAPQSPDQFREAACAAVENPFSMAAGDAEAVGYMLSNDASRFASWTFAHGGDMFDYESNEYAIDSDAAIDAMEFIQGLFADGCAMMDPGGRTDQSTFGAGTTLFTVGSSSGLPFYQLAINGAYETSDFDGFAWNVGAIPHVTEEPVQNIYGASVALPHSTTEQEVAAWQFVKFYTHPVTQGFWARASNYFPVRYSAQAELEEYFAANPQYQAAFDLLPYGVTEPPVANYEYARDIIREALASITQDPEADVIGILEDTNTAANENLADMLGN